MALTKVSYSMINGEPLNVLDYGAVGNSNIETGGGTDDTAAILLATADAIATGRTLFAPSGYCFRITDQINMIGVEELQWQGLIYADNITTKPAVRIGGWSNGGSRKKFFINEVHDGGSRLTAPTFPLLQICGLKGAIAEFPACRFIEIFADDTVAGIKSTAYNSFTLGQVYKLRLRGADANSWINENYFYGGRLSEIIVGTTTTENYHNHNLWFNPTMEGPIILNFQVGYQNRIYNARFEGVNVPGTQVTFAGGTFQNFITTQQDTGDFGSQFPYEPIYYTYINDAGFNNLIYKDLQTIYNKIDLFTFDARTPFLVDGTVGGGSSYSTADQRGLFDYNQAAVYGVAVGMLPGLKFIESTLTFREIFSSDFIPVTVANPFGLEFKTAPDLMRFAIRVYDADFKLLGAEGVGGAYIDGSGLTYNGSGTYSIGADLPSTDTQVTGAVGFGIRRNEVKYIKIFIGTGSVIGAIFHISLYYYEPPNNQPETVTSSVKNPRSMVLPTVPTAGYVALGTQVNQAAGASIFLCTFSYETTTNGALALGATSVTVTTIGSVSNGCVVGILLDSGSTHWSVVSGLAGSTFTVAALPSAAASGNRIVFNKWATK